MKIKLTKAQDDLLTKHLRTYMPKEQHHEVGWTDHQHITLRNPPVFLTVLRKISADLDNQSYSVDIAREKFAAKYLLRKLEPLIESQPPMETEPTEPQQFDIGATVYLRNDPDNQTFRIMCRNSDGSWQVFGGTTHHQSFRDFTSDKLTTIRPKGMPSLR